MEDNIFKNFNNLDKRVYKGISIFIVILLMFLFGSIFAPEFTRAVANIVWMTLLIVVGTFVGLGILVIFGLRKEANRLLDLALEGGMTLIDFLNFLKELWELLLRKLKEFILFASPIFSYTFAFILYYLLMLLFRVVGLRFDVSIFTIFLTIVLVTAVALLTLSKKEVEVTTWFQEFKKRIGFHFIDGVEVFLFVFFLTLDIKDFFILPEGLRIHLRAQLGSYDLMHIGYSVDALKTTSIIVIVAIVSEIVRNILRIVMLAIKFYRTDEEIMTIGDTLSRFKASIRKSFNRSRDDLIKFAAFNTLLLFVFLVFPRLKLLSMAVASMTMLVLDIIFPKRLVFTEGNDIISRTIYRVLRI